MSAQAATAAGRLQAQRKEAMKPEDVLPGSNHCRWCGEYAESRYELRGKELADWWQKRRDAAERAGLDKFHVLCDCCSVWIDNI